MRQRDHFGEAMSGIPGAFLGEAIRTLIQIDALQSGYTSGRLSALPKTVTFLPKPWKPLDVINFVRKDVPPET
jgi:hypothetical protein